MNFVNKLSLSVSKGGYPSKLTFAKIIPILKKTIKRQLTTIGQSPCCQLLIECLRNLCLQGLYNYFFIHKNQRCSCLQPDPLLGTTSILNTLTLREQKILPANGIISKEFISSEQRDSPKFVFKKKFKSRLMEIIVKSDITHEVTPCYFPKYCSIPHATLLIQLPWDSDERISYELIIRI